MSKLWTLTKVLFKTNLFSGNDASKNKKKNNKFTGMALVAILLMVVVGCLGVPIILTLDSILEISPLENIFISLILPLAGVTTIVFSIFSVVSVFYLSKDSEQLLSIPIASKDIMMSKFLVSLVNEYYILLMFILPCLIGVGVGVDAGIMYYVYTAIIFLLLPVIPSAIVVLIILLVTRFIGIVKNKDLFMYVSIFFVLVFSLGYNFIIQEFIAIDPENVGATFGSLENEVIPYFKWIFPFYNSASDALMNFNNINGVFSLITFISFNVLALIVIYLIGDKLYLRTLTVTKGSKKKKGNIENVDKLKKSNVFSYLLKKEWLVIKRTPIFMLNIVVIIFLMPIIFIMSFAISYANDGMDIGLSSLDNIDTYLSNPMIYLVVITVCVFFASFSLAASTSISREGSDAWMMKVIPVSAFKQINVKVFFASLLDLLSVGLIAIMPIILLKIPFYYVLSVCVPVALIIFILNYFNIYLDLRNPKIKWSEESVAVKQNMNSLISVLLTIGVSIIFSVLAYLFYKYRVEINVVILSGIISVVCGIILAFVISLFKRNEKNLLDNVD